MSEERDYTRYSFRITFLVIAIMLVISLVPPFSIGNIHFKRVNILSDIITFSDDAGDREGDLTELDKQFMEEADLLDDLDIPDADALDAPTLEHRWDLGVNDDDDNRGAFPDAGLTTSIDGQKQVEFQDYTPEGSFSVADFSLMIEEASKNRVVRIAFFGDSYIEGDIITGDIREQMQDLYGGQGVGFVSFGNPLAISRPSIKHTFEGWENYNLIYKKNTPEEYKDKFFISGTVSVPKNPDAWAHYKGVRFRKHLSSWSRARLIFINNGAATIDIAVNDSIKRQFKPDASDHVQQINLAGSGMKSLNVSVGAPDGFIGYGVVLEGASGVSVDNYAIRSNSGLAMFGTDRQINTQIGRMLGYDMIVLQWGLNAMDPSVTNYNAYGQQLRRVINYMKACFPKSAIVVMGVGDRGTQKDGEFVTMDAVHSMIAVQKAAAEECEVAFWNTFEAMGGQNSMAAFVEKNWAAKDYTHLSYGGGRYIAGKFVQALRNARNDKGTSTGEFEGKEAVRQTEIQLDMTTATEVQHEDSLVTTDTVKIQTPPQVGQDSSVVREAIIPTDPKRIQESGLTRGDEGRAGEQNAKVVSTEVAKGNRVEECVK